MGAVALSRFSASQPRRWGAAYSCVLRNPSVPVEEGWSCFPIPPPGAHIGAQQGTVPALILSELLPSRITPGKLCLQWMGICWGQEQDLCLCGRSAAGDSPGDQSASE